MVHQYSLAESIPQYAHAVVRARQRKATRAAYTSDKRYGTQRGNKPAMSRLRRRELVPEDTQVTAVIEGPKAVYGKFGRQVEAKVRIVDGDYKGVTFKDWFSFGKDNETEEEFIPYGSALYSLLAMAAPEIDEVLDDEKLTERQYQGWIKQAVAGLENKKVVARVGIKSPKNTPDKKRNFLQPGTLGPHEEQDFAGLSMG